MELVIRINIEPEAKVRELIQGDTLELVGRPVQGKLKTFESNLEGVTKHPLNWVGPEPAKWSLGTGTPMAPDQERLEARIKVLEKNLREATALSENYSRSLENIEEFIQHELGNAKAKWESN